MGHRCSLRRLKLSSSPSVVYTVYKQKFPEDSSYIVNFNGILSYINNLEGVARRILSDYQTFLDIAEDSVMFVSFDVKTQIQIFSGRVPAFRQRLDQDEIDRLWDLVRKIHKEEEEKLKKNIHSPQSINGR